MSISLVPHRDASPLDRPSGTEPIAADAERKGPARNALRHGLSGSGMCLPDAEAQHAVAVEDGLLLDFQPTSVRERILIQQMAVYHVKAQQCHSRQHEVRAKLIDRTTLFWDSEKRLEALELAKKLADDPEATAIKLTLFKQGVDWIIGVLVHLLAVLDKGDFDASQRKQALDVLGVPLEFRKGSVEHFDDADPDQQVAKRRRMLRHELERLKELNIEHHITLDQANYRRVARGLAPELDHELRLLARYERDALRRFQWVWHELKQLQKEMGKTGESEPMPESTSVTKQAIEAEMGMTAAELGDMVNLYRAHHGIPLNPAPAPTVSVTTAQLKGNRRQRRAEQALHRRHVDRSRRPSATS